jgi:hypothetical protein
MARGNNVHDFFQRSQTFFQPFQAEAPVHHWATGEHYKLVLAVKSSNAEFVFVNRGHGLSCRGNSVIVAGAMAGVNACGY